MKRPLTVGAVGALIMGVSIPAAALPTVEHPAAVTVASVAPEAAPQMFASSASAAAATITRDTYTVEEIVPEPVYLAPTSWAGTYTGAFGGFTVWPANGPVNDGWGYRDGGEMHSGIDIMAPAGSPIVAAAAGVVIEAGYSGGWGNYVKVDHGDGIASLYAHMSSIGASPGQVVAAGDYLGAVGATGYATANHLHFEVYVYGSRVDPMGWF